MARGAKSRGGSRGQSNKKNYGKKTAYKKPNRYLMVKKQIERNKESEDILKRQQLVELKYNTKNARALPDSDLDEGNEAVEVNDFQELLTTLRKSKKRPNEVESSESESSDEESEIEQVEDEQEGEASGSEGEEVDDPNDSIEDLLMNESEDELEGEEAGSEIGTDVEDLEPEETVGDKTINTEFLDDSVANDLLRDEESDSEEFDSDIENEDKSLQNKPDHPHSNPFSNHLKFDLSPVLLDAVSATPVKTEVHRLTWPALENLVVEIPKGPIEPLAKKKKSLLGDEEVYASEGKPPKVCNPHQLTKELSVKQQIVQNIPKANHQNLDGNSTVLTPLQTELVSIACNYQDLYYPHRSHKNGEQIRLAYCIHALDHVLKTRQKVLHHNSKIAKLKASKKNAAMPDDVRDQGFTRPRVLIVLPFRDSAYRVVNMLLDLLNPDEKEKTVNYNRFVDEFTGDTLHFPKRNPKPEDYEQTFAGNTEDTFRLGISLNKKSMKLYAPFYSSDILIASPLGLRLIIGAPGEKDREYDFLASIEMLIMDQMELFLAQNWDHLLYMMDHLHLQPQSRQNTDFSRVRSWCLNGWSKFYRQSLLFSSYDLPEFRSLLNNRCHNYSGKVKTANIVKAGSIRHVMMEIPQIFHRIEVKSLDASFDTRFEYFTNTVLPQFKSATMAHCMIYVPSYFDYVRIRNYFKKEEVNFTQICEYTKDNKISRARTLFYHGGAHILLYSERAHFFRRMRIKGVRHIVMYQLPLWNNFYPEMINLMQDINQNPNDNVVKNAMSVTILYTKYDILQLSAIVGHDNVAKMLASKKQTHMFMNNE